MVTKSKKNENLRHALTVFRQHGGVLRTKDALQKGIHPRTLYALRDDGQLEQLSRGIYRLASAAPLGHPDLVTVALRAPASVVCLISALSFHELTTQIPHEVSIAIIRGAEPPRIDYPPIQTYWFSGASYSEGIQTHQLDGVPVRIYNREKTIADCFRYRHKIGLDTCLESLHFYKRQRQVNVEALLHFASIRQVKRVLTPYLQAIL